MREKQIVVNNISKTYKTHIKSEGFRNLMKSFFNRKYESNLAVKNVSFSVEEGSIMGLIGLNGAGKTTIIKMVSGVMKADNGDIKVLNKNPFDKDISYRRKVSLIMGNKGQLDYDVSILDNILLYASIYGVSESDFNECVKDMKGRLALSDSDMRKQVRNLSLGQRMKGELMLAFLHKPKIIFLDEPTLGLDFITQRTVREYLKYYKTHHKASIILTSHYIKDIEDLCDEVLILNKGESIFYGSLDELKNVYSKNYKIDFTSICDIEKEIRDKFDNVEVKKEDLNYSIYCFQESVNELLETLINLKVCKDIKISEDTLDSIIETIYKENNRDQI